MSQTLGISSFKVLNIKKYSPSSFKDFRSKHIWVCCKDSIPLSVIQFAMALELESSETHTSSPPPIPSLPLRYTSSPPPIFLQKEFQQMENSKVYWSNVNFYGEIKNVNYPACWTLSVHVDRFEFHIKHVKLEWIPRNIQIFEVFNHNFSS